MSARSRKPWIVSVSIESKSSLVSSRVSTGVLPRFTTCFGPWTECAGLVGTTCPTTSQSKSIRTAARLLLDARLGAGQTAPLDERCDDCRVDAVDVLNSSRVAPVEEVADGATIGPARVGVADVGGEELDEAPGGARARCWLAGSR